MNILTKHTASRSLIIFALFTGIMILSCNENQTTILGSSSSTAGTLPLYSETDTLMVDDETVIEFVSTTDLKTKPARKWSSVFVEDSTGTKDDSGYLFTLQNGEKLRLENSDEQDENEDATDYRMYAKYWNMDKINHWLFEVEHYEWSAFELIDKQDGEVTEIVDFPIVSPLNNKIIVASEDLDSEMGFNGIQFLRIKNKKVELMWTRELVGIGLSDARWVDNDTVIFKRVNPRTHKIDYVKAVFK